MINKAITFLMKLHSHSKRRWPVLWVESLVRMMINSRNGSYTKKIWDRYCHEIVAASLNLPEAKKFINDPSTFLESMAIIVGKRTDSQKGIIQIHYTYALPMFLALFDIDKVMKFYHIVLEPSWTGYCDGSILCYAGLSSHIFIESLEPKDRNLLRNVSNTFIPMNIAPNWYVDYKVFKPHSEMSKDADICMIAAWSKFKRHNEVFDAVSKLKQKGKTLRLILIGYKGDMTKDDIYRKTKEMGLEKQIELFEGISTDKVAEQLSRCKVNIVWSKREGSNRAIIEGFFCDVPGILRDGHNYGHKYEYINDQTGMFSSPDTLCDDIIYLTENYSKFQPRKWVMENMTCHNACNVLAATISTEYIDGSHLTPENILPKINGLHGLTYFDAEAKNSMKNDYDLLLSCLRKQVLS